MPVSLNQQRVGLIGGNTVGGGTITGGGTLNYIPKFTPSGTALGNSLLFDNGVSVGAGTLTPDASAIFDLTSTTQGFLTPRMTTAQRNLIASPATGLMIYNTDTSLFEYWDGIAWQQIDSNATSEWLLDGNTNGSEKYIGTNDTYDFPIWTDGNEVARFTTTGALGLGTTTPNVSSIFDATSTTRGVLFPRMTTAQRNAIATPATSLWIYNTTTSLFNYYDGSTWQVVDTSVAVDGWSLDGNTVVSEKWIGTIDTFDFPIRTNNTEVARYFTTGNYSIGSTTDSARVSITGSDSSFGTLALNIEDDVATPILQVTNNSKIGINGAPDNSVNLLLYTSSDSTIGCAFINSNTTSTQYGGKFFANGVGATTNVGGYFTATGGVTNNWAIMTDGGDTYISNGGLGIRVAPDPAVSAYVIANGGVNIVAGYFNQIGTTGGTLRGLEGHAVGVNAGTNIGGQFSADNGANNYALLTSTGLVGFGISTPTAKVNIVGDDSVFATKAFYVQSSALSSIIDVRNSGNIGVGGTPLSFAKTYIEATGNAINTLRLQGDGNGVYATLAIDAGTGYGVLVSTATGISYSAYSTTSGTGFSCNPTTGMGFSSSVSGNGGIGLNVATTGGNSSTRGVVSTVIDSGAGTGVGRAGEFIFFSPALFQTYTNSILKVTKTVSSLNGFDHTGTLLDIVSDINTTGHLINANSNSVDRMTLTWDGDLGLSVSPLARFHAKGVNATTDINQRLEPVATVTQDTLGATFPTTDATTSTAQTLTIPSDSVVNVIVTLVYRKTAGAGTGTVGDGTSITLQVGAKNVGGTVTLTGAVQNNYTGTAIGTETATLDASGATIRVRVTGITNDDITWNVISTVNTVA